MANYIYKQSRVTTKKLAGVYDAATHSIDVDGSEMDVLEELECFNDAPIEFVVKIKDEIDLTEE